MPVVVLHLGVLVRRSVLAVGRWIVRVVVMTVVVTIGVVAPQPRMGVPVDVALGGVEVDARAEHRGGASRE